MWRKKKYTHETYSSVVTFCSSHAMASSVIYYSTEAQKNEIYLFYIIIKLANIMPDHAISWRHPCMCTLITHSSQPMKMENERMLYNCELLLPKWTQYILQHSLTPWIISQFSSYQWRSKLDNLRSACSYICILAQSISFEIDFFDGLSTQLQGCRPPNYWFCYTTEWQWHKW